MYYTIYSNADSGLRVCELKLPRQLCTVIRNNSMLHSFANSCLGLSSIQFSTIAKCWHCMALKRKLASKHAD